MSAINPDYRDDMNMAKKTARMIEMNRAYGANRKTVQAEDSMTGTLCTCVVGNH
jgi:flagellar basal body rod protein FlgG